MESDQVKTNRAAEVGGAPPQAAGCENLGSSNCDHDTPCRAAAVSDSHEVLAKATAEAERFLDRHLQALFEHARQGFFIAARDASTPHEETRQVALMENVEALAEPVSTAFRDAVLSHLARIGERLALTSALQNTAEKAPSAEHVLSLVETLKLDDWVRLRTIFERHLTRIEPSQLAAEERLGAAIGTPIDSDNNPLGLIGICSLFHDVIQGFDAVGAVRQAIFEAFEATIVSELDELLTAVGSDEDSIEEHDTDSTNDVSVIDGAPDNYREAVVTAPNSPRRADAESAADPLRLGAVLNAITRNAASQGLEAPIDTDSLQVWLTTQLKESGCGLEDSDRAAIRCISELAANVLQTPSLDASVKARLWPLIVPMLTLALRDDGAFMTQLEAARHDPLTGLLDGPAFDARLTRALGRKRDKYGCILCLIAIDDFASIESALGRSAAARLLRHVASLLNKHVDHRICAARLPGNEFALLLEGSAVRKGQRIAEQFRTDVERSNWAYGDKAITLSVSIGVAAGSSGDAIESIIQAASDARAKACGAGGNRVAVEN